jgi:restriction system protein
LAEILPSGGNKWTNRIQWVRQRLIDKGEMYSPSRGIWAITEKGRNRVETKVPSEPIINFVELYEEYEASFRSQLLDKLSELTPHQFELFARKLLQAYGFVEVNATGVSPDGGIDGYGKLRLGLATMNVAFQCKRWQGNVSRPEVDKFRGAIQGEFEQGVFFVTSDFTSQAREASLKKGAVPIILLNGESIVDLMIQKGIGVERNPLFMYYERPADFVEEEGEKLAS